MQEDTPILLDTHVLIWVLLKPNELDSQIKKLISTAQSKGNLLISSISLWEIAMLKSKKRINVYEPIRDFLNSITNIEGLKLIDLEADIAAESTMLTDNFHGDPADRIITATSIIKNSTLVTRDNQILAWAEQSGCLKILKA